MSVFATEVVRLHRAGLATSDPRDAVPRLTQAFRVLGGVSQRGIFDNMKTAIDRIGAGNLGR